MSTRKQVQVGRYRSGNWDVTHWTDVPGETVTWTDGPEVVVQMPAPAPVPCPARADGLSCRGCTEAQLVAPAEEVARLRVECERLAAEARQLREERDGALSLRDEMEAEVARLRDQHSVDVMRELAFQVQALNAEAHVARLRDAGDRLLAVAVREREYEGMPDSEAWDAASEAWMVARAAAPGPGSPQAEEE